MCSRPGPTTRNSALRSYIPLPFSIHWKRLQAKIIWKKLLLCITLQAVTNAPHETRWSPSNKIFAKVQSVITQGKEVPMITKREKKWVRIWDSESLTTQSITNLYLEISLWNWNPGQQLPRYHFTACPAGIVKPNTFHQRGGVRVQPPGRNLSLIQASCIWNQNGAGAL